MHVRLAEENLHPRLIVAAAEAWLVDMDVPPLRRIFNFKSESVDKGNDHLPYLGLSPILGTEGRHKSVPIFFEVSFETR
jgi:hypothetical protein